MSKSQKRFILVLLVLLSIAGLVAQQQQSGGGGGGSVNVATVGGSNVTLGSKTSANSIPVVIASDNAAQAVSQSGTWGVNINASQTVGISAGTAIIGKTVPNTTCGTVAFSQAWVAVPQVSTAVTATTTCVQAILFTNTNASAQTVTVTDGQGSPVTVIATYSIPGNSQVTFPMNFAPMTTGVKWAAGGSGITGAVFGYQ